MKVADYILDFLVSQNIKHVFLMTGGAISFTVDAFHSRKDIEYICIAHEQSAAMAADMYARVGPGFAATMVTSGPGATNLLTGICCSWFDSIPVLHISGQVNTYEQKGKTGVRQIGFQETDIVSIVKPVTKFAAQIDKAENIRYLLEKATFLAKSGRPGPVLLDIPQNFQRVEIDPKKLKKFNPKEEGFLLKKHDFSQKLKKTILLLKQSERPVLLFGFGVRISKAEKEMMQLIETLKIPVVTSWSGKDLFDHSYPYLVGQIGVYGNRGANFTVQNADLLLSIGSRLDTRQTGGKTDTFAREAKRIIVDIDKTELNKKRVIPDIAIQADAKEFLLQLLREVKNQKLPNHSKWLKQTISWKKKYPPVTKEFENQTKYVNPYVFSQALSRLLDEKAVVVPDDGGHLTWTMQGFEVKGNQRLISAFGNSPMGYALPAAMGGSFALGKKQVICIDGDGSLQINIQELQTIVHHKLPVKIFVLNNEGYGIIKQFQELYLNSRFEATGKGYSHPDFIKIAKAYGLKAVTIENNREINRKIRSVLKYKGPVLCNVKIHPRQLLIPKLEYGKPIEDLSPLLDRKEFRNNMIIQPIEEVPVKPIAE